MASGGDIGSLPPEVLEKAKRELNEDPDQIAAKIQELRELVQQKKETGQTGDTPLLRLDDDAFLLRFLRAKKYRLDDVCKLYLNYCEYRITHKEVMEGLCLDKVRYLFEDGILGILEPRTKSGCRIMVIFPGRTDLTDAAIFNDVIGAEFLLLEKMMEDPSTQVHGMIAVEDWTGVSSLDIIRYTISARKEIRKLTDLYEGGFPIRMKSAYNLREPHLIDAIVTIMKPFLSQKLKDRVKFLGHDFSSLFAEITPDLLPEEFGGTMPPFSGEYSLKFLEGRTEDTNK